MIKAFFIVNHFRLHLLMSIFPFIVYNNYAMGNDRKHVDYQITKNIVDNSLSNTEALFVFTFKNVSEGFFIQSNIKASCNGIEKNIKPDLKGQYSLKLVPGKYTFQFFYNEDFYEIQTDSIKIEPAHRIEITVNFESSYFPVQMRKPVIYVYPQQTTPVNIKLDLKGEFIFTYPQYNNGWSFTADPNGTIHMNNKEYQYLFWDGNTNINAHEISWNEGFVVNTNELLGFLENKLTVMGLNSKEQQDFITYWYPLMSVNKKNYIHFVFNEDYNQYANISVTPKPDNMFRVYMIWANADEIKDIKITEQNIPSLKREGFTIVEWGGSQIKSVQNVYGL